MHFEWSTRKTKPSLEFRSLTCKRMMIRLAARTRCCIKNRNETKKRDLCRCWRTRRTRFASTISSILFHFAIYDVNCVTHARRWKKKKKKKDSVAMSRPMPSHCRWILANYFSTLFSLSFSPLDRRKLSSGAETTMSRASYKSLKTPKVNLNRKLEMEFNKALASAERRRQKSGNDYKTISSSSSAASSDAENDSHIDLVLTRSRDHLENIQALKKRRDFLRPEDYVSLPVSIDHRVQLLIVWLDFCRPKLLPRVATIDGVWKPFCMDRPVQCYRCVAINTFEVSAFFIESTNATNFYTQSPISYSIWWI